ncbi:MAG: T9SS type A sorting domain-containing protein [Flavobacteriales bacterium]|nr:T9SS type A sorting domain-containing protein [Flavobacteriales bacterium]
MKRTIFLPSLLALSVPFASAQLPFVDLLVEHDDANAQLHVFLRANDYDFGELVSSISFSIRWPEASAATLGFGSSAWCPYPNSAFQPSPGSTITAGNGFKYKNWTFFGLGTYISAITDDGGCDNSLLADTWIEVATIPVNNDPGATAIDVATDQYAIDNNLLYYISLNGVDRTGGVFSGTTAVAPVPLAPSPMTIAPNPANASTTITLNEGRMIDEVEIMDTGGRVVRRDRGGLNTLTLDVRTLESGAYQLIVRSEGRSWAQPMLIAR